MARIAGKNANFALTAKQIEDELSSIELAIDVPLPEVTCFSDTAPVFVEGKPSAAYRVAGAADMDSGEGDDTITGMIGGTTKVAHLTPTGSGPSASNPDYNATVRLKSYGLRASVGEAVNYNAEFQAITAVSRAVA